MSTVTKVLLAGAAVAAVWWLWEGSRAGASASAGPGAKVIQFPRRFALGGRSPWIIG